MIHLGDITKIHGDQIEPVDCITFGSPCQDLSIAGRRAGLAGERSGLFMEAVRIIKEMREATHGMCPTFAVWENVPGAFSSNSGEDFRAVLEELACVEQPDATIPRPPRGADGAKPEQSAEADGVWLGDSLMLNIGEKPSSTAVQEMCAGMGHHSVARESLLSQILEVNAPQKYFLSVKACQGILIRASRRGKALPELLKTALLDMIEWWEPGASEATVAMVRATEESRAKQERIEAARERKDKAEEHALKKLHKLLRSIAETGELKQKYQGRFKQKKTAGTP